MSEGLPPDFTTGAKLGAPTEIVAALNRNTAALLTVCAEIVAFSLANKGDRATEEEIKRDVLRLYNQFLVP